MLLALLIVAFILWLWWRHHRKESFTPEAARLSAEAPAVLAKNPSYAAFKAHFGDWVDPVVFDGVRRLWRRGQLTPATAQSAL